MDFSGENSYFDGMRRRENTVVESEDGELLPLTEMHLVTFDENFRHLVRLEWLKTLDLNKREWLVN